MFVIDCHAHIVPENFSGLPSSVVDWPAMQIRADGDADMVINGQRYRVIERAYFDLAARLSAMDRDGVDLQVISPLPELLSYWLELPTAVAMAELVNQVTADAVQAAPGRLEGLGMLPLQDITTSVQMVSQLSELGLRGVQVGSNVNGVSIASSEFDPVFAALEAHNLCVFVHGIRPAGIERLLGPRLMGNVIGIPQDGASAIASFITTDILGKFPALRLGFAHAGGSFGSVLGRMNFVWREHDLFRQDATVSPCDYVRKFFFDTITYSVPDLQHLMLTFGIDGFMCGSDGPTLKTQRGLEQFVVQASDGDEAVAEKMLWRNSLRFLDIAPEKYGLSSI